jgi:Arc/MetJ-type ribon-helix-helix transcriptional regulator
MLFGMQTTQIAVRLPQDLLARLDRAIPSRFESRADAVRAGLDALLATPSLAVREQQHRDALRGDQPSKEAMAQMHGDARALIAEEPW